uniref:Dynein regulatory complex protein 1 n=1 Tax=Mastacembelus armatus TaxID=205130 RepID=A0A7N8XST3_9TELE
ANTSQKMVKLRRDLTTLVTNIQTAADAKECMQRTELEEARRIRLERLEKDVKSSQEKFEEITRGWAMAKEKVIPQELQEALNSQQQLCSVLIEDKKKLISDLQQELKVRDDRYVKDLRKQAEELDLMMERMEDQIKTLTKAYREEMAQAEVRPDLGLLHQDNTEHIEYTVSLINMVIMCYCLFLKPSAPLVFHLCPSFTPCRHFATADARKFKDMWLMLDAEVKQLVEKLLHIDSLICEQHLGLSWERPTLDFTELSRSSQPQIQRIQEMTETSAVLETDEMLSRETMKKVMELLCDEAGFLVEEELLKLLTPLEKEEQTVVKLASGHSLIFLCYIQASCYLGCLCDVNVISGYISKAETIFLYVMLMCSWCFLRESSTLQQAGSLHPETWDSSAEAAYWERMGNIISEDKVKLWEVAENTFKHAVLTEISELVPETESLRQQNTELRMLLQQSLNSRVSVF